MGMSTTEQAGEPSILAKIKAYKLEEVAARKAARSLSDVEEAARAAPAVRSFRDALDAAIAVEGVALIAEIKKASPSKGLIRADFNPPELARMYEDGGAACLSVLTDGPSFQGDDAFLTAAREAVSLPALRKDFMYDPYQVVEARALGADCILIILASVSDPQAQELEAAAVEWGMDVLLETHNEAELERALQLKSGLVGVNNRDLHSFETKLETTERLAPMIPADRLAIAESGLFEPADWARMARAGARAALIGESLMRRDDVAGATRALIEGASQQAAAGMGGA
ncbi:MAG: indole-3-glycerol phosphate synthase TrpC [Neomegalonema sp.]|nr:indole-3-glycerol phosphate synthase TrpC [Neomegalonema sp.]